MEIISINGKNSLPYDFQKFCKYLENEHCLNEDKLTQDINELALARDQLSKKRYSDNYLVLLDKYEAMLRVLEQKYSNAVPYPFAWSTSISPSRVEQFSSLYFEHGSLLFQRAAVCTQLAQECMQNDVVDSVKACQYLQASAGTFKFIYQKYVFPDSEDLRLELLKGYEHVCLAYAQACVLFKAIEKKSVRVSILAKIASQVAVYFTQAESYMRQAESVPNYIFVLLKTNYFYYKAIAHQHFAKVALESSKFGVQVGHLNCLIDACRNVLKQSSIPSTNTIKTNAQDLLTIVEPELTIAMRDNDLIHLEAVPTSKELASLEKIDMVRSIVPQNLEDEPKVNACFLDALVSTSVYLRYKNLSERAISLKKDAISKLETLTDAGNELVSLFEISLQKQTSSSFSQNAYNDIIHYSKEIKRLGGTLVLSEAENQLNQLIQKTTKTLTESKKLLQLDDSQDSALRLKYGTDRWKREATEHAARSLLLTLQEHELSLRNACEGKANLDTKLRKYTSVLLYLESDTKQLFSQLENNSNPPSADELRLREDVQSSLTTWKQIQSHRQELHSISLPENTLELLNRGGKEQAELLMKNFQQELHNQFNIEQQELEQSLLFEKIQAQLSQLQTMRSLTKKGNDIESLYDQLTDGYQRFIELREELTTGLKFVNDLYDLVHLSHGRCMKFCDSRNVEAKQIISNLESRVESPTKLPKAGVFDPTVHKIRFQKKRE